MFMRMSHRLMAFVVAGCLVACDSTEPVSVAEIVITPGQATLVSIGETVQLSAIAKDAAGNEITGKSFTWASSAANIASIDGAGKVTAAGNGQTQISASVDGITATAMLGVAQVVSSVVVTPAQTQLASINETVQLTATAKDALGNDVAGKTATWVSSAASVASILETGVAKAAANGSATMTATIDNTTGTATVTVSQVPAKLAFTTQPRTTQNGLAIPPVGVQVQDALGTPITSATNQITLAVGTNPASGALGGTKDAAAAGGVATFSGLSIDNAGNGYTLSASASGLTAATSSAFDIISVPVRIDSIVINAATVKIGGNTAYSAYVTVGRDVTNAVLQGNIIQSGVLRAAGGVSALGCSTTAGKIPHGSCKLDWSLSVSGSQGLVAGAATARIDISEGGALRAQVSKPVTLAP